MEDLEEMWNEWDDYEWAADWMEEEQIIYVWCPVTKETFNEKNVSIVGCVEGVEKQDVITFLCPTCKVVHNSYRR